MPANATPATGLAKPSIAPCANASPTLYLPGSLLPIAMSTSCAFKFCPTPPVPAIAPSAIRVLANALFF